jgi:hypothetical protein
MLGLNAKSEPLGMIRAVFDLFDHVRMLEGRYPLAAIAVLGTMNKGTDMTMEAFNTFVTEHELFFGTPPMKEFGSKCEPIVPDVGGREMPPRMTRKWTTDDWDQMNARRLTKWQGWIRAEMDKRNWDEAELRKRFRLSLPGLPAAGYRPITVTAEDRTERKFEQIMTRLDSMEHDLEQIKAMVSNIHAAFFEELKKVA